MANMITLPLKNLILERIKENGSLTDSELSKKLTKEGFIVPEDKFNKLLLDLEIMGLITVSCSRRIEFIEQKKEKDEIELQNKEMMEKDYEASFPGTENGQ